MAYLYLENADQGKYGTILTGLNEQQLLKNDQYPKTITETANVLSNHKFDNSQKQNKEPAKNDDKDKEEEDTNEEETPL
eukprot:1481425-Ditylum_brightwellii.AAC.1